MRVLLRSVVLVALAGAVGCGDDPTMEGRWSGTFQTGGGSVGINLTLTEDNNNVSGSGRFSVGGESVPFTVDGVHPHPDVSLTLTVSGFSDALYEGTFKGDDEVIGELNGSGFNHVTLDLRRR